MNTVLGKMLQDARVAGPSSLISQGNCVLWWNAPLVLCSVSDCSGRRNIIPLEGRVCTFAFSSDQDEKKLNWRI